MFYWIGLLVAKVMLMDMVVPLTLNPAFFKYALGGAVILADIDHQLAQPLANSKAEDLEGMPFACPRFRDIPLKEGGKDIEVTSSNPNNTNLLWKSVHLTSRML